MYDELIKALRICSSDERCDSCPMHNMAMCQDIVFHYAAAAIEKLQAQIPQWISVDERLPETDSVVLCFCRAHLVEMLMFAEDCWIGAGGLWSKTEYMKDYVTYWMTLPEPPKEVDEDG